MSLIQITIEAEADVDDSYSEATETHAIETALRSIGIDVTAVIIDREG